jgi:hypothetical protein
MPSENYSHSFARPEAALEQHNTARSFVGYRSATIDNFNGGSGEFRSGGGGRRSKTNGADSRN